MSTVVLKDGKLVYERYNENRGFDDRFLAHGMSMTKTAVVWLALPVMGKSDP